MSVERMSIAAQCYFIFLMKFGETQLKEISQEIIQAPLIHLNPNSQTQEFLEAEFIKSGYLVNGEFTEKAITHNVTIINSGMTIKRIGFPQDQLKKH
ncbi:hypothetical protein MKT69_10285 [Leptospira borgpetersenii]|uniref:hypothetical protein n=1 Tax=Leptospira borgpetersenii TaxID=174 RepID=UPI0027DB5511|nr:hypothetical protein [Leptospira borgpetersenii]MCH1889945.1 hypothetical protein [Leptospira borgpetersenii]